MNAGKIIGVVVVLALIAGLGFWVVSGDDSETATSEAPTVSTETAVQDAQSAATPADELPGQTTSPGFGSTESQPLTLAEVSNHNVVSDCWTIVDDVVYDITAYVPRHPGGESNIARACGTDGTDLFNGDAAGGRNHSSNARSILSDFELGPLES